MTSALTLALDTQRSDRPLGRGQQNCFSRGISREARKRIGWFRGERWRTKFNPSGNMRAERSGESGCACVAERVERVLDLAGARLPCEYYYSSVPLCVIDAVFSIGVRYGRVRAVVKRYCDHLEFLNHDLIRSAFHVRSCVPAGHA